MTAEELMTQIYELIKRGSISPQAEVRLLLEEDSRYHDIVISPDPWRGYNELILEVT